MVFRGLRPLEKETVGRGFDPAAGGLQQTPALPIRLPFPAGS